MYNNDINYKEKESVQELARCQFILVRYLERNNILPCNKLQDIDSLLFAGKLFITYGEAIKNLNHLAITFVKNQQILNRIKKLYIKIVFSSLATFRFGIEPCNAPFLNKEWKLYTIFSKEQFDMDNCFCDIRYVESITGIKNLLHLCEEETLLNTKIIKGIYYVHIPECEQYFQRKFNFNNY